MSKSHLLDCQYAAICSGCSYWGIPLAAQLNHKTDGLRQDWESIGLGVCPEIEVLSHADRGLRDRLDFRLEDGRFGLFDRNREQIVDLEVCPQLSPALEAWYQQFRKLQWPFAKASIRLRVSYDGKLGVWFDLSNTDVKNLLDQQTLLRELMQISAVEIGQRRKNLIWDEDDQRLRLAKEPHFQFWTRTWAGDSPIPLLSRIADFSQPGDAINKVLVSAVSRHFQNENIVMDWGAGSGNLSFPALQNAKHVWALDHDEFSLLGLKQNLRRNPQYQEKMHIERMDFHKVGIVEELTQRASLNLHQHNQTWIVDPPRSGAGALFYEIPEAVTKIISVSCFKDSFLQDSFELNRQGFKCQSLALVDQFPQTHHGEWVSKWQRS